MKAAQLCPVCREPYTGRVFHTGRAEPLFVHTVLESDTSGRVVVEGCVLSDRLLRQRGEGLDALPRYLAGSEPDRPDPAR